MVKVSTRFTAVSFLDFTMAGCCSIKGKISWLDFLHAYAALSMTGRASPQRWWDVNCLVSQSTRLRRGLTTKVPVGWVVCLRVGSMDANAFWSHAMCVMSHIFCESKSRPMVTGYDCYGNALCKAGNEMALGQGTLCGKLSTPTTFAPSKQISKHRLDGAQALCASHARSSGSSHLETCNKSIVNTEFARFGDVFRRMVSLPGHKALRVPELET